MSIEEHDIDELRLAIEDMKKLKVIPTVAADIAAAQTELDILVCRRGWYSYSCPILRVRYVT